MQLSGFRKFKSILLLVVCMQVLLLIGQGILQDVVLCIGSDGHVAMESAYGNGDCGSPADIRPTGTQSSIVASLFVDHCGPCLDLGISGDISFFTTASQDRNVQLPDHVPATLLFASIPSSQSLHAISSLRIPSCINTPLHSLRSVILLI